MTGLLNIYQKALHPNNCVGNLAVVDGNQYDLQFLEAGRIITGVKPFGTGLWPNREA
jgi:hypothetical protein